MMLNKNDITALRSADALVFKFEGGRHTIRCNKDDKAGTVWDDSGASRLIVVDGSFARGGPRPACEVLLYARNAREWQTVARLLRAGDALFLRWSPDGATNEHLRRAGLHGDVLSIEIKRATKARRPLSMWFDLSHRTTPQDTARMFQ